MTSRTRRWASRGLGLVAVLYLFSAIVVFATGGYSVRLGGPLEIASHSLPRDLVLAATFGGVALFLRGRTNRAQAIVLAVRLAVALMSFGILVFGLVYATRCACGADSYGYVSQAHLWRSGTLRIPEPLMATAGWPFADWTLSPLGYRPATTRNAIVPLYPPGLPLTMALASAIGGTRSAVFVVVPILGAAAIWIAYALGRRIDELTGFCTALLTASSPTFLFQVIQPMSDIPATAWWLATAVLIFGPTATSAFFAGLTSSAAVLTRPNLVPLSIICAVFVATVGERIEPGGRTRRTALYCLGALPGPLLVAWIQWSLYGSPFKSGYGSPGELFAVENIPANLRVYFTWLLQSHGPWIFLGLAVPAVWMSRDVRFSPTVRKILAFTLIFALATLASYLSYAVFDNWTYTRFLLPALPMFMLAGVVTATMALQHAGVSSARIIVTVGVIVLAASWVRSVHAAGLQGAKNGEQQFVRVAQYVGATAPEPTLVISMQHSGSLRYYGARTTVRYDWIQPHWLDETILRIHGMNRGPLLLLERWEEPLFRKRFEGQRWGALDWPARVEFGDGETRLYDPFDRDRALAHEAVHTITVR